MSMEMGGGVAPRQQSCLNSEENFEWTAVIENNTGFLDFGSKQQYHILKTTGNAFTIYQKMV